MRAGRAEIEAVIFDTDGVVTKTAVVHFTAWKRLFDEYLAQRAEAEGDGDHPEVRTEHREPGPHRRPDHRPFTDDDYRRFVDGMPRYDGVANFLASRGISLPRGDPSDPPGDRTVCALGNQKNTFFLDALRTDGVEAFSSTVAFVEGLHAAGIRTAVISASKNCAETLTTAGVDGLFEVRVDGVDAAELGLPGKPDPAVFVEAARRLGVEPGRAAIVEDAIAGVEAGRAGGFGMVIGIDRTGHPDDLARFADIVVPDLDSLTVDGNGIHRVAASRTARRELPPAMTDPGVRQRIAGRQPAVFLDYDGTLTPIVARPELAVLPPATRDALTELARHLTVGIISGRDLADVQRMVAVDGLWYAGSHGLDIVSPTGARRDIDGSHEILARMDRAEAMLADQIATIPEAWVERKRFAIAVHYRQTPDEHVPALEAVVARVAADIPGLRTAGGKKIFELRPDLDWDKGVALRWVLQTAGLGHDGIVPVYIGDDVTDEDAFAAIHDDGLAVVVGEDGLETAAHFRLTDTDEVSRFLRRLLDLEGVAP